MSASDPPPHTYYVAAVVAELARHGVQVSDWDVHAGQPLVGYIQLAGTNSGQQGAVVCGWCEERGWFHGRGGGGFERVRRIAYVGGVVLPAPGVIAGQLARAVATVGAFPSVHRDDRLYRASDDDGLRARLAVYAPPQRHQ